MTAAAAVGGDGPRGPRLRHQCRTLCGRAPDGARPRCPEETTKAPDFRGLLQERMKGLEPSTFCMARGFWGFCGSVGLGRKLAYKQGFLGFLSAALLRPNRRFCAPLVGWTWDGIASVVCGSNFFRAPRCICVSPRSLFRSGCAMLSVAKLDARAGGLLRAAGRPAAWTTTTPAAASRRGSGPEPGLRRSGSPASSRTASSGRCCAASTRRAARVLRAPVRERTITVRTPRRGERRVAGGAEAPRAGVRLRPRLLVPEERQPAARADRRRGGAARDQRGARGVLAGRARLSRARGLRRAPRPRRRGARARRGVRGGRVPASHQRARRTRTCTRT